MAVAMAMRHEPKKVVVRGETTEAHRTHTYTQEGLNVLRYHVREQGRRRLIYVDCTVVVAVVFRPILLVHIYSIYVHALNYKCLPHNQPKISSAKGLRSCTSILQACSLHR